jgi:hypothetical protein
MAKPLLSSLKTCIRLLVGAKTSSLLIEQVATQDSHPVHRSMCKIKTFFNIHTSITATFQFDVRNARKPYKIFALTLLLSILRARYISLQVGGDELHSVSERVIV